MKKLKQLWAIFGMIAKFLPRLFREIDDVKVLWQEMKSEWREKFPPDKGYIDMNKEISFTSTPGRIDLLKLKARRGKTRNKVVDHNSSECPEKLVQFPGGELERSDDDINPYMEIPDGRSYFKKKGK